MRLSLILNMYEILLVTHGLFQLAYNNPNHFAKLSATRKPKADNNLLQKQAYCFFESTFSALPARINEL
jgi:hypothetical protein